MKRSGLVERIYEAAFVPEYWPSVLEGVGRRAQSVSGAMIVFEDIRPVRFMATPQIRPWTERFCAEQWKVSNRVPHIRRNPMAGFSVLTKYFGADFMQRDTSHVHRLALGLDSEAGTAISMPNGDIVVFSFDKSRGHGPHDKEAVRFLDALRPHLGRAGLIAARVGVERGLATASALQMIGLPAAVLDASGRILATNALFDALSDIFLAAAFGRVAIAGLGGEQALFSCGRGGSGFDATAPRICSDTWHLRTSGLRRACRAAAALRNRPVSRRRDGCCDNHAGAAGAGAVG